MIDALLTNNLRWAATRSKTDYFKRLSEQSPPRIFWIGCTDCRVPASEMIGLEPGEVFVHRNLANQADPRDLSFLASLHLALDTLSVEHIIVCGHYGCSGVHASLREADGPAELWLQPLHTLAISDELQAVSDLDARANLLCERNVAEQVYRVAANPLVRAAWRRGHALSVHGWVFSVHDGLVRDLGVRALTASDVQRRPPDARVVRRPPRRRS